MIRGNPQPNSINYSNNTQKERELKRLEGKIVSTLRLLGKLSELKLLVRKLVPDWRWWWWSRLGECEEGKNSLAKGFNLVNISTSFCTLNSGSALEFSTLGFESRFLILVAAGADASLGVSATAAIKTTQEQENPQRKKSPNLKTFSSGDEENHAMPKKSARSVNQQKGTEGKIYLFLNRLKGWEIEFELELSRREIVQEGNANKCPSDKKSRVRGSHEMLWERVGFWGSERHDDHRDREKGRGGGGGVVGVEDEQVGYLALAFSTVLFGSWLHTHARTFRETVYMYRVLEREGGHPVLSSVRWH